MKRVEVEYVFKASPDAVLGALSPERIVDYEGVYDVQSVDDHDSETVVTASAGDVEITLEFYQFVDGYRYEQRGTEGPFESMETRIQVETDSSEDGATSRVSISSSFTFGSIWSVIVDRLATGTRRKELRRLGESLAVAVDRNETRTPGPSTEGLE